MSREGKARPPVVPSLGSYATNHTAIAIARRVARLELFELERRIAGRGWRRFFPWRVRQTVAQAMLDEVLAEQEPVAPTGPQQVMLRVFTARNAAFDAYLAQGGVGLVPPLIGQLGAPDEMALVVAHRGGDGPKILRTIAAGLGLDASAIGDQTVELRLSGQPLGLLTQRMTKMGRA